MLEFIMVAAFAFMLGFFTGGLVIMDSWKRECKSGITHIGGRAYRCTPIE